MLPVCDCIFLQFLHAEYDLAIKVNIEKLWMDYEKFQTNYTKIFWYFLTWVNLLHIFAKDLVLFVSWVHVIENCYYYYKYQLYQYQSIPVIADYLL